MSDRKSKKHFPKEEKVAILKRHLLEKVPISNLCDELGIQPGLVYHWQKVFFENGTAAFEKAKSANGADAEKDRTIAALEQKLRLKNEVLAELMQEHVQLKKELGEP